jgi:predicted MFS family arabinose efflux permease
MDRRYLLIGLTLIMIIANSVVAFASDFSLLLFGRVLLGISIGGSGPRPSPSAGAWRPRAWAWPGHSIIMVGVTLATVLGVPVGTWLSGLMGWRMTFLVTALVGVPVLLAQVFLLPRLMPEKAIRISDLPALFINPQARVGLIAVLLIGLAHFAAYTYVAPFFKHSSGFDGPTIGSLLLLYGVAGVLAISSPVSPPTAACATPDAGRADDRHQHRAVPLLRHRHDRRRDADRAVGLRLRRLPGLRQHLDVRGRAQGCRARHAAVRRHVPGDHCLGSFFGGRIVDQLGSAVLLSLATALVGCGFVTVLVLGRNVSNRLAAEPC